jgi:hypothetical protein
MGIGVAPAGVAVTATGTAIETVTVSVSVSVSVSAAVSAIVSEAVAEIDPNSAVVVTEFLSPLVYLALPLARYSVPLFCSTIDSHAGPLNFSGN